MGNTNTRRRLLVSGAASIGVLLANSANAFFWGKSAEEKVAEETKQKIDDLVNKSAQIYVDNIAPLIVQSNAESYERILADKDSKVSFKGNYTGILRGNFDVYNYDENIRSAKFGEGSTFIGTSSSEHYIIMGYLTASHDDVAKIIKFATLNKAGIKFFRDSDFKEGFNSSNYFKLLFNLKVEQENGSAMRQDLNQLARPVYQDKGREAAIEWVNGLYKNASKLAENAKEFDKQIGQAIALNREQIIKN